MPHFMFLLPLGVVLLIAQCLQAYILMRRKIARFEYRHAPKVPTKDSSGFSKLRNHPRARKDYRWPVFLKETFDSAENDVQTASHRILSQEMLYTRDPENIKTILSSPMDDYGLGGAKEANFDPLFGSELFTAEGQTWQHYWTCARLVRIHI